MGIVEILQSRDKQFKLDILLDKQFQFIVDNTGDRSNIVPEFLSNNDKRFKFLLRIFTSIIFQRLTEEWCEEYYNNYNCTIKTISNNDVTIVSICLSIFEERHFFEGAINNKTGEILSSFKEGNGFSSSDFEEYDIFCSIRICNATIDEKHEKFITNNAIYDFNGKVIYSGFKNIIDLDLNNGNYLLFKESKEAEDYIVLFNSKNKAININIPKHFSNIKFTHSYIEMETGEEYEDCYYDEYDYPIEFTGFNHISSMLFDSSGKKLIVTKRAFIFCDKYIFVSLRDDTYDVYTLDNCKYLYRLEWNEPKSTAKVKLLSYGHDKSSDTKPKTLYEKFLGHIIKASIPDNNSRKYGYVLFPQKIIVPFQYDYVSLEYKEYAIVGVSGKKGLINSTGTVILKPIYDFLEVSINEHILLSNNGGALEDNGFGDKKIIVGGAWGAVRATGEIICEPYYDEIRIDDKYLIVKKGDKCGLMNVYGDKVLDTVYDDILSPTEELIAIKTKTKYQFDSLWGFVDLNGEIKIRPQFEKVGKFYAGRAIYKQDGRYGFIDINGEKITPPLYSEVKSFDVVEQKAKVYIDKYYNYVNLNGELLADWLPRRDNVPTHFNDAQNEEQHYNRYNRTYAQAYEGWSDEEIDEAFDGNPEAYWNID